MPLEPGDVDAESLESNSAGICEAIGNLPWEMAVVRVPNVV